MEDPQWKLIDPDRKAMIDCLLLEKLPLAGIARVMQLSEGWLQGYVNACYAVVPQHVQVQPKAKGHLAVQMDELWSFVDDKGNKHLCGLPSMLPPMKLSVALSVIVQQMQR